MTSRQPDIFSFGEKVLVILEEGTFTATYKFAVLLALVDLCMEQAGAGGEGPRTISTRDLAAKVVEIYWPHTRDFATRDRAKFLRQNAGGQAEILSAIRRHRDRHGGDPTEPLSRTRRRAPEAFERLIEFVEFKLIEMPLPRLQKLGKSEDRFLYDFRWNPEVRRSDLRAIYFDRRIHLREGVSDFVIQLAGLLRPLIQRRWASMVARLNVDILQTAELEDFLFGATRVDLAPIRQPLRAIQENRCFYCQEPIRGPACVDHFIPWARHPDDGIENLVVTDPKCNANKRDFFASVVHLSRWKEERLSNTATASALADIAERQQWERHPEKTATVARSLYRRLPAGSTLWNQRGEFVPLDRQTLDRIFPAKFGPLTDSA
jgi:hypothetical protein